MDQKSYFSPNPGSHAPPQSSGDREDQPRFGLCSLVACPGWSVCPVHPLVCSSRPSARRSPSLLSERRPRSTGAALSSTCTGERGLCLHPTSATKRFLLFVSFLLSAVIWNFHHNGKKRKTDAAVNGPLRFRGKSCCCSSGFGSGLCWLLLLYVGWPGWKLWPSVENPLVWKQVQFIKCPDKLHSAVFSTEGFLSSFFVSLLWSEALCSRANFYLFFFYLILYNLKNFSQLNNCWLCSLLYT